MASGQPAHFFLKGGAHAPAQAHVDATRLVFRGDEMNLPNWVIAYLAGIASNLISGECSELSPWLARKVIKAGAHLLLERDQVTRYEEDWLAGLNETPGKLSVLLKALGIVFISVPRTNWDYIDCIWSCTIGVRAFTSNIHRGLRWPRNLQRNTEQRAAAHRYNQGLKATCRTLRHGDPTARAEALNAVEYLANNPPPWVTVQPLEPSMLKFFVGREIPHFRQSLRRRGLLSQDDNNQT